MSKNAEINQASLKMYWLWISKCHFENQLLRVDFPSVGLSPSPAHRGSALCPAAGGAIIFPTAALAAPQPATTSWWGPAAAEAATAAAPPGTAALWQPGPPRLRHLPQLTHCAHGQGWLAGFQPRVRLMREAGASGTEEGCGCVMELTCILCSIIWLLPLFSFSISTVENSFEGR